MKSPVTRRSFLKALGTSAACVPLVNLLGRSITEAQATAVAPLRLILINNSYHATDVFFHPRSLDGRVASAGSDFTLNFANSALAPLSRHQSKLLIFRGLNYQDSIARATSGHMSNGTAFTGATSNYSGFEKATTNGRSIDQYLWSRMKGTTIFQPLILGANPYPYGQEGAVSWAGNGVGLHPNGNPLSVFNTLFGNFGNQTGGANDQRRARRFSVLNLIQNDLGSLMNRLAGPERIKLSQHADTIMNLRSQIIGTGSTCTVPSRPMASTTPFNYAQLQLDSDNMSSLVTQAFACDLTRFASITYQHLVQTGGTYMMPGLESFTEDFHAYTHSSSGVATNDADIKTSAYHAYWALQISKLMDKLALADDPTMPGQKLLENTMIVWVGEHGNSSLGSPDPHKYSDIPIVVAGGCGGMFRMGRLIEASARGAGGIYAGVPHNALLSSIVNAFEINQQRFNPAYVPNVITQFGDFAATPLSLS